MRRAFHEASVYFGLAGRSAQTSAAPLPMAVVFVIAPLGGGGVGLAFGLSRGAVESAVIGACIAVSIVVIGIRDRRRRSGRADIPVTVQKERRSS